MKACKDCKHVVLDDPNHKKGKPVCHHPKSLQKFDDFYEGGTYTVYISVTQMRQLGGCDRDAKLFEPLEPEDTPRGFVE